MKWSESKVFYQWSNIEYTKNEKGIWSLFLFIGLILITAKAVDFFVSQNWVTFSVLGLGLILIIFNTTKDKTYFWNKLLIEFDIKVTDKYLYRCDGVVRNDLEESIYSKYFKDAILISDIERYEIEYKNYKQDEFRVLHLYLKDQSERYMGIENDFDENQFNLLINKN